MAMNVMMWYSTAKCFFEGWFLLAFSVKSMHPLKKQRRLCLVISVVHRRKLQINNHPFPDLPIEWRLAHTLGWERDKCDATKSKGSGIMVSEGYWTSEKFLIQLKETAKIADAKYPRENGWRVVWTFDHSSCHAAMPPCRMMLWISPRLMPILEASSEPWRMGGGVENLRWWTISLEFWKESELY